MNINSVGLTPKQQNYPQTNNQRQQVSFGISTANISNKVKYPLPRKIGALIELAIFTPLHYGQKAFNGITNPIEVHLFGEDPTIAKRVSKNTLEFYEYFLEKAKNILKNKP